MFDSHGKTVDKYIRLFQEHEGSAWKVYEFKWKGNERVRFPQTLTANYPGASTEAVLPRTVEDFSL